MNLQNISDNPRLPFFTSLFSSKHQSITAISEQCYWNTLFIVPTQITLFHNNNLACSLRLDLSKTCYFLSSHLKTEQHPHSSKSLILLRTYFHSPQASLKVNCIVQTTLLKAKVETQTLLSNEQFYRFKIVCIKEPDDLFGVGMLP